MSVNKVAAAGLMALTLGLGACAQQAEEGYGQKTVLGAAVGAAGGGLLASQLGGGATGIAAGVLLGGSLGSQLDDADRRYAAETSQHSFETSKVGTTTTWTNPDSGHSGTVTPTKTYQTAQGEYCREFQQTVTVGGKTEDAYGTACRQPDGSWKIVQ